MQHITLVFSPVMARKDPTVFDSGQVRVKQGCPALSPLLSGLFLDELENLLEAPPGIDAPRLANILLAIMCKLLFADDIASLSYSASGLQKQLHVLAGFCAARGLTVNVNKTP